MGGQAAVRWRKGGQVAAVAGGQQEGSQVVAAAGRHQPGVGRMARRWQ